MRTLLAGPWIGEFGWEIVKWVPFVRKYVKDRNYDEVYVLTRSTSFPLYEDFATQFINYETTGDTKLFVCDNKSPKVPDSVMVNIKPSEVLIPSHGSMLASPEKYEYKKYGIETKEMATDIVAHARSTTKTRSSTKNWLEDNWWVLSNKIRKVGRSLSFIGNKDASFCPPGFTDLRGLNLVDLMNMLASSNLCIGPSSGPMHLASFCGCPHLVWGDDKVWNSGYVKSNLEDRYKKLWNPFNSPCEYVMNHRWNPTVSEVFVALVRIISF